MLRVIVYSILLVNLPGLLVCQERKYVFNRLSAKDGLASNHVYSILQDQKGFIWLGTASGLQRYDGRKIVMFRPPAGNQHYLPAAPISQMFQDLNHNFWVRTGHEIGIFDPVTYQYRKAAIITKGEVPSRAEYNLFHDSKGNVFLIITQYGVLCYDAKNNSFQQNDARITIPKGWNINLLIEDPKTGNYWLGADSGLAHYNIHTKALSYPQQNTDKLPAVEEPLFRKPITVLFIDNNYHLRITTWKVPVEHERFYCYDLQAGKMDHDTAGLYEHSTVYKEMHGYLQQKNGMLWSYGQLNLLEYDTLTHRFAYMRDDHIDDFGIKYDYVYCMFEDREQNTWVGTDEGVYMFNPDKQVFSSIVMRNKPPANSYRDLQVNAFLQTSNTKDILVATWGLGTLSFDSSLHFYKNDILKNRPAEQTEFTLQWDMHQHSTTGFIWIGCQNGNLIIYDPKTKRSQYFNLPAAEGKSIRQITEDKAGNIWLGTQYGHLIKWNSTAGYGPGFLKGFTTISNIQTIIYKLTRDNKGFLWIGTHRKGVYKIDPTTGNILTQYKAHQEMGKSLYEDVAGDILQYNDSLFYICTGALNILNTNTGQIKIITNYEGLPSMSIRSLEKDKEGNVWLGLSDGICRYNPKRNTFTLFSQKDGIIYGNFEYNAHIRLANGKLIFGNPHNMMFFQPEIAYSSPKPLDVTITDFKLFNAYLPSDSIMKLDRVDLHHTQNSITIEFASLSFLQRDKIMYFYQLEGIDNNWVRPDKGLFANYTSLPPGHYTFKVKCENADGITSQNITSLKIYIHPPFYRTWWFMTLIVLCIAAFIYFIHRLRVNRLLGMEKVRTRIARDLHDDMGSTLSTINILSEMAKMKVEKDTAKTSEYLNKISDNSNRMMEAMDDIVWSINPLNDNMQRITARMREFATGVLEARNIDFTFRVEDAVQHIKLDMEARRDLFLLFKEAVNNLAKYAQCQKAGIEIFISNNKLIMNIVDNGVGFEVSQADSGNGLINMQKRAQSLKGHLTIDSKPGQGARVSLQAPLT